MQPVSRGSAAHLHVLKQHGQRFVGQRTFIGNATCSAGAFIRADACLPAQWRRRSYTREVRVSTACPGRSWALLLLNHCPGVALNHILEPLLPRRQHVRRLQEVAGVLMHSKSRSDPFATVSRAPLTARTASTPVLHLDAPSLKRRPAGIEPDKQGAPAESRRSSDIVAAAQPLSAVRS